MTRYHFNGDVFYTFADLCNAYFDVKGYYPTKPQNQDYDQDYGLNLYY